jgi:hypothetical protein
MHSLFTLRSVTDNKFAALPPSGPAALSLVVKTNTHQSQLPGFPRWGYFLLVSYLLFFHLLNKLSFIYYTYMVTLRKIGPQQKTRF